MIKIPYHLRPLSDLTSEDQHQAALIEWTELPEIRTKYPMLKWLFAVPNGGKRLAQTGSVLKQTGVKAGVPDLLLLYPMNDCHGLIIEMKYGKNTPSKEQKAFMTYHTNLDYRCVVCYSWIEATQQIICYLSDF